MNIQSLFRMGMKRDLPSLLEYNGGLTFDIGSSGTYRVHGAIPLGAPSWVWPKDRIPAQDESVTTIHCYHFLEHLSGDDAILFLREAERVMIPGRSVFNFCVPYHSTSLMAQDLTHRSSWCEDSFRNLFDNHYYSPAGAWELKVHFIMIAGIVERNICLIGQLTRGDIRAPI